MRGPLSGWNNLIYTKLRMLIASIYGSEEEINSDPS